jgi:branched-chain amino acid transport system substrate-binding protein
MPRVARYIADGLKAKSVAVIWMNNDFGKGGRDAILKELQARNVKIAADISTDPGQVDYSSAVLKAKSSGADVLFPYLTEEESARLLRELRKQNYDKPIVGETTILEQKVIELAGAAANGVRAHVGLTHREQQPADARLRRALREGIQVQAQPQRDQGIYCDVHHQGRNREGGQVRPQGLRRRR